VEEPDLLQEKVKSFNVREIQLKEAKSFVERWHYSSSVNGVKVSHVFGLFFEDTLIGVMIYGPLAMANTWKRYSDSESKVVELRRLCCIDKTPRNTESYFIGKTIKYLKKNTNYEVIVSYADPFHGHSGIIYRASNFEYGGLTQKGRVIKWGDKLYHDKAIRCYYVKGGVKVLKPYAVRLKQALEAGEAFYMDTPGKHIYTFKLR
jgi:hypothetical protein